MDRNGDPVAIAGGGIAGLATALTLARAGLSCTVFEQAPRFDEVGAGIQLSPNASRILSALGVLPHLGDGAVRPSCVALGDGRSLEAVARVPLDHAEERWGAPYLVMHRADLQRALLAAVAEEGAIELRPGTKVAGFAPGPEPAVMLADATTQARFRCRWAVGADGVNSVLRSALGAAGTRAMGTTAWRATIPAQAAGDVAPPDRISVFLSPGVHLVAYPVRAGREINLVAFAGTDRRSPAESSPSGAFARLAPALRQIGERAAWTAWPLKTVDARGSWFRADGLVLVGDAAHAMTPYAAQGAAMAIEDAAVLAACVAETGTAPGEAFRRYEALRRPRIARVMRRGALNELAWHAAGPIALVRNLVLSARGPEGLAADLDWLYGWAPPG